MSVGNAPGTHRRIYLDDAALLGLAVADDRQAKLREVLAGHVREGGEIWTSAAALEGMQRAFLQRAASSALREFWNVLNGLFQEIVPLRGEDLARSIDLVEAQAVDPVTALHAAICLNQRLEQIVDLADRYDAICRNSGLERVSVPAE